MPSLAFAALFAILAPAAPRLTALVIAAAALYKLRLHPRKTVDIDWSSLLAALRYAFVVRGGGHAKIEAAIAKEWSTRGDGIVSLSVRTAMDTLLTALNLPSGSEVLFAPGITIPAVVQIVESHGLRAKGMDPGASGAAGLLSEDLGAWVSDETRILVITHLFGAIFPAATLISEAHRRGIFVIEDCAQAFVGASVQESSSGKYGEGFHGHEESDAAFVSFGFIKTLTALGGAVGHVRDEGLRRRMQEIQAGFPIRPASQFFVSVVKACVVKVLSWPCLWGLAAAVCEMLGLDFDERIIQIVRGFPNIDIASIRQRPSLPLLLLLKRRLTSQYAASFCDDSLGHLHVPPSSVSRRRVAGAYIASQLTEKGVDVVASGVDTCTWWLLPVLDEDPQALACALWRRGFDATSTSTQLAFVGHHRPDDEPVSTGETARSIMNRIIYLPLYPDMSASAAGSLAAAVLDTRSERQARGTGAATASSFDGRMCCGPVTKATVQATRQSDTKFSLSALALALILVSRPSALLWLCPSLGFSFVVAVVLSVAMVAFVAVARHLAAAPQLRVNSEILRALAAEQRMEEVESSLGINANNRGGCGTLPAAAPSLLPERRIDGAVLLTGATGFVGGGVLHALLSRAEELGVSRIVVVLRRKAGTGVEDRLAKLRASPAFDQVREVFGRLVVAFEGDVAQHGMGHGDDLGEWPYKEPLRVVLHCAGDVRFDQRLQLAALSSISATLQAVQVAARWGADLFLFVSTAFVHAVPSSGDCLEERLVELRDLDPMELYRDAIADGRWALKAMRELGFPNTYTFTKAITEHLVIRLCTTEHLAVRIVRPSIVGPAWAAPFAGWAGEKPSTIVAGAALLARRGIRVFCGSEHPTPIVPVDLVAGVIIAALTTTCRESDALIMNAAIDASESNRIPSFRAFIERLFQVLGLCGELPLPEVGLLHWLLRLSKSEWAFRLLHTLFNVAPNAILDFACLASAHAASILPSFDRDVWKARRATTSALVRYSKLPMLYAPFTSPPSPWLFRSDLRLPVDWNSAEYCVLVYKAAIAFHVCPNNDVPTSRTTAAALRDVRVSSPGPAWVDALVTFSTPGSSLFINTSAFLVRRALSWMNLTITVDAASLVSVSDLAMPLVLCPTHRSLLDFVIIGSACFQLHPLLPTLQLPHVAADAEFSRLPILGHALEALGAFFVRRGAGEIQPDPALRREVGRVFRVGRPIEVFLEGMRSRGRRQLRLRTGFLRALREVSQRTVALVPIALSYELLPEDRSFYNEMQGFAREPLRTFGLVSWVLRGIRGELPSYGAAHVRLGDMKVLDASSDLSMLLVDVQEQLVKLTTLTSLHTRALAELLVLEPDKVLGAFCAAGLSVRKSRIGAGMPLSDAERWPLALQAATLLRNKLPLRWAWWLIEPVCEPLHEEASDDRKADDKPVVDSVTWEPAPSGVAGEGLFTASTTVSDTSTDASEEQDSQEGMISGSAEQLVGAPLDLDAVVKALSALLESAEAAAQDVASALRESGTLQLTEQHLVQQLLRPQDASLDLPAPLACGAAYVVVGRLISKSKKAASKENEPTSIAPLWIDQAPSEQRSSAESLERWGYKDTRFVSQWVDGQPAVQVTSRRYATIGSCPLFELWSFFQAELAVSLNVRCALPDCPIPKLPPVAEGLVERLTAALPGMRVCVDVEARLRAGTGHGLADIWRLRTGEVLRVPDAVVRPESEDEVLAVLEAAQGNGGFAVVPVGGRTNVTSALSCPPRDVDARPFVALDMRGLASVRWVNSEDCVAFVEAGVTGAALKEVLQKNGVTMGMEPDSMEFSTLGGWIATRASGMKRSRYGNIEDMIIEVRVATPAGVIWQHQGATSSVSAPPRTAIARASTNVELPGLVLGSEGCLGVIVAAVVRVRPLPEVVEYQSVVFPDWQHGAAWMREVARLPVALRPASCRLMDSRQLRLARAIHENNSKGKLKASLQTAALHLRGVSLTSASAATLVFEGSVTEVRVQRRELQRLVKPYRGIWGGSSGGEAGYALTFAIAYLRDFCLDHRILAESLETLAPWSVIQRVWPAVVSAVEAEHWALRLPGRPLLSCRMTQLYDEGGVLYMYVAIYTLGLSPERALTAFQRVEHAARAAVLQEGGCLSHHHGIGKLRAPLLSSTQAPLFSATIRGLKAAIDPENILGARNGVWSDSAAH